VRSGLVLRGSNMSGMQGCDCGILFGQVGDLRLPEDAKICSERGLSLVNVDLESNSTSVPSVGPAAQWSCCRGFTAVDSMSSRTAHPTPSNRCARTHVERFGLCTPRQETSSMAD
jgi:hypothetical protein